MGWRMKNFNILGVHRKIQVLGGGHKKPIYRGHCLKRGPWKTCRFTGGLGKKEGVVFLKGGLIPQCTLWNTATCKSYKKENSKNGQLNQEGKPEFFFVHVVIIPQRKKLHIHDRFKLKCTTTFFLKTASFFLALNTPSISKLLANIYKINKKFNLHTALWYFKKVSWRSLQTS